MQTGFTLGQAIGNAAVTRRSEDGYERVHAFSGSEEPGRWRPAPPGFATSNTTDAAPFLFATRDWDRAVPPSAPGSPALLRDVAEVRRMGADLKQELGLGHYEGRAWRAFHHHATLCIAAYGFLIAVPDQSGDSARQTRLVGKI